MSEPAFFQTIMGRQYYDGTVPRIADALEHIAESLQSLHRTAVIVDRPTATEQPAELPLSPASVASWLDTHAARWDRMASGRGHDRDSAQHAAILLRQAAALVRGPL